jgi:hypothetical protein
LAPCHKSRRFCCPSGLCLLVCLSVCLFVCLSVCQSQWKQTRGERAPARCQPIPRQKQSKTLFASSAFYAGRLTLSQGRGLQEEEDLDDNASCSACSVWTGGALRLNYDLAHRSCILLSTFPSVGRRDHICRHTRAKPKKKKKNKEQQSQRSSIHRRSRACLAGLVKCRGD